MDWRSLYGIVFFALITFVSSQSCNTDQNPYCRGNSKFEQLCCPYPSVCYWADRAGTPACCPAGQSCQAAGGVITAPDPTTVYTTYTQPTTQTETQPAYSTITSYLTHPTTTATGGGVVYVTTTEPDVWEGATSTIASVYSTVTSDIAGAYSTVTSNIAGAFTTVTSAVAGAATTLVQVLDGEADQMHASNIALAVALAAAIWHFV